MGSDKNKDGWARYVIPIAVTILTVAFPIYWAYGYYVPSLVYRKSPPYKLSEEAQATLILVTNEGPGVATKIRVRIETTGEILAYRGDSVEKVTDSREGKYIAVSNVDRLGSGVQIEIYVTTATRDPDPIRKVSVTFDQGVRHEKATPEPRNMGDFVGGRYLEQL